MGDLLRIDLTSRTATEETIAPETIRDYIGGKGVGTHYLLEEVGPDVDPLSPDNKLIFVTGPINGTTMFGGNRYGVHFVSPLTGGYGECTSGGNVAPQFARTGYKVVIVEGASDTPVYLEVSEGGGTIHAADDVWGLDTFEAEERLVARHKADRSQSPGLRHRARRREARALRLRREQQVAQPGPRRRRRRDGLQEAQGRRLPRRQEGRGGASRRLQGAGQGHGGRAARTTPAWRPTGAAAPSTWCACSTV